MGINYNAAVSWSMIQGEFGGSNPISISEYYRGGGRVGTNPNVRTIPNSGTISAANFRATSAAGNIDFASPGTTAFQIPLWLATAIYQVVGGGGGGQQGNGNSSSPGGAGAGGGAGSFAQNTILFSPGEMVNMNVGSGGIAGMYGNGQGVIGGTSYDGWFGGPGGSTSIIRQSDGGVFASVSGGVGGSKWAGTGNIPNGDVTGNWDVDPFNSSWKYGAPGIASAFAAGGVKSGYYTDGGNGSLGSGGGGGSASNWDPNDYSTNGGYGGNGFIRLLY